MSYREQPLLLTCAGHTLVGVLARPDTGRAEAEVGVLIVVGGPQYRAGSHRQFVQTARALAQQGHPVLRFDVRGMGDAEGTPRSFDQLDDDIGAALDGLLAELPGLRRVVLFGLCDGASAALLYCQRTSDPRIAGLCLLNPWVRSTASLARAHVKHYYWRRVLQREFWQKLIRGRDLGRMLTGFVGNLYRAGRAGRRPAADREANAALPFQHGMARGWRSFEGPILLVLSELDYTAKEFLEHVAIEPLWNGCLQQGGVRRIDLSGADHTFSASAARLALQDALLDWLQGSVRGIARVPQR